MKSHPDALYRNMIFAAIAAISILSSQAQAGDTLIVPGQRIGGISLGMTSAQLYQAMGNPAFGTGPDENAESNYYFGGAPPQPYLVAHVHGGRVDRVATTNTGYATVEGVHVGSSTLAIEAAYGPADSAENMNPPEDTPDYRHCYSSRGLLFRVRNGVAYLIAVDTSC